MAIWPFIFTRYDNIPDKTLRHELIHFEQQKEWFLIGFYVLYLIEYLFKGYRNISFEIEAYNNAYDKDYLKTRKKFANYKTMFKLSDRSKNNIADIHPFLKKAVEKAIEYTTVDFGILDSGGRRTAEEQNELYSKGYSRCNGYKTISYHQTGKAVDLVPYVNGKFTWKDKHAFLEVYKALKKAWGEIDTGSFELHWGGFWGAKDLDSDGTLEDTDKLGWDCAHSEMRLYKQTKGVYQV